MTLAYPSIDFGTSFYVSGDFQNVFFVYINENGTLTFFEKFEQDFYNGLYKIYSKKYPEGKPYNVRSAYQEILKFKAVKILMIGAAIIVLLENNSIIFIGIFDYFCLRNTRYLDYIKTLVKYNNVKDIFKYDGQFGLIRMNAINSTNSIVYFDSTKNKLSKCTASTTPITRKLTNFSESEFIILGVDLTVSFCTNNKKSLFNTLNLKFNTLELNNKPIIDICCYDDIVVILYLDNSLAVYYIDLDTYEITIENTINIIEETENEIYVAFHAHDGNFNFFTIEKNVKIVTWFSDVEDANVSLLFELYKTKNPEIVSLCIYGDHTNLIKLLSDLDYKIAYIFENLVVIIMDDNSFKLYETNNGEIEMWEYLEIDNIFSLPNKDCKIKDYAEHVSYI